MSSPTNGATVSGTINQAVNATDNVGVTKVEFLRDGVVYGQDTTSPFTASLDTTTVTNGAHTLGARAYDAAGNVGNATNATVTVSNALPVTWLQPERHHLPTSLHRSTPPLLGKRVLGQRQLRHMGAAPTRRSPSQQPVELAHR